LPRYHRRRDGAFQVGGIAPIRNHHEIDQANTCRVYLCFESVGGSQISQAQVREPDLLRSGPIEEHEV
jgi:hypothetical protein